jgi:predicted ferric reductase/Ca2+-binding EF-hand superfamily protein
MSAIEPGPPSSGVVARLESAFAGVAGADARIDPSELQKALGLKSEYLARRIFAMFDRDGNGIIEKAEFLDRVRGLVFGTDRQKLRFVFRLHDHDEDGFITRQELDRIVHLSLLEDGIEAAPGQARALVNQLFFVADQNRDGKITFDELEATVRRYPQVLRQITRSEASWLAPNECLLTGLGPGMTTWERVAVYAGTHGLLVAFVALWLCANGALFAEAVLRYQQKGAGPLVQIARGCGACLNFDSALVLVPMLRSFLTWIRRTPLHHLVPVDDSVSFHKLVGYAIVVFSVVHTGAHLLNYALVLPQPVHRYVLGTRAGLTGVGLIVALLIMAWFARGAVRRSGRFERFYFSHLLYWIWFPLLLAHGPVFWMWGAVPLVGYLIERVLRAARRSTRTEIVRTTVLRSGVTRVDIRKPDGFDQGPGDYAFVRVPALAPHEWHPFTISSAPERPHSFSMHVRSLGNWTGALRRLAEAREREGSAAPVPVFLDGPFGTPTAHIFAQKYAVMVGAGIGVTPFASILESILLRSRSGDPMALRKVHFVWLNRDQYSFEWFAELLAELEALDRGSVLEIHTYLTGARLDLKSAALGLAREVLHAAGHRDLVTGLRARTHLGRPDWDELLGRIAAEHAPDRVGLFFCGPSPLGRELRRACRRHGLRFRQEHF